MWATRRRRVGRIFGIPRANLLAEYRLDEGAGQWAYNRVAGAATLANILPNLNQLPESWLVNGLTVTRNYATDPDGGDGAARLQGVGWINIVLAVAPAASSYTFSVYLKSNTGASQDVRLSADNFSTFTQLTITTSWQRYTLTKSIGNGGGRGVVIRSDAGNNALDIVAYGVQYEAAAAASAYEIPRLHLHLGAHPTTDSGDPSWANGGLHLSGTTMMAAGTSALGRGVTNLTVYALARWTDGAVTPATRETQLVGETGTALFGLLGSTGATNPWLAARHGGTANYVEAKNVVVNDGNWFVVAYTYDGTTQRLWYNGYEFYTRDRALAAITLRSLYLGGRLTQANTWPGDIAGVWAYADAAHSAAQVLATTRAIKALYAARGITVPALDRLVVVEGDSISAGWDATNGAYSWYALPNFASRPYSANRAIPGSRMTSSPGVLQVSDRAASIDAMFDAARTRNILSLLVGVNDLAADGDSGAILYGQIKAYCQARKATGWRVAVGTILPTTQPGSNGVLDDRRTAANALIRNAVSEGWADAIFDFAADATMGPLAAASNTGLYSDGTHPTATAHQTYLAPIWRTAVEPLL